LVLIVSLILAGTTSSETYAQGPEVDVYLVKDIHPGPDDSWPVGLTEMSGRLFFGAGDGTHGYELWTSDGTVDGTIMVKDIAPGSDSSWPLPEQSDWLTTFKGRLFFSADDGTHGYELWTSDGTAGGTVLFKDINPSGSSWPFSPTEVDGRLYFNANDGTHGGELWTSDGTPRGSVLFKDINPGSGSSLPLWLTEVNGRLFFTAYDGANGRELWTSDGTAGGTLMLRDIKPGSGSSHPQGLIAVNGTLLFCADDGTHGVELWTSDGTAGGTVVVKDIHPGPSSSCVHNWRDPWTRGTLNGTLLFKAGDEAHGVELWTSDGTAGGTVMVKDINPGSGNSWPAGKTEVNGWLFFRADNGRHGFELWAMTSRAD
jgi:ELWxxDGT repeat protein